LASNCNNGTSIIASELNVSYNAASKWIHRLIHSTEKKSVARLNDLLRFGAPDTFTAAQVCKIIAICYEPPADHGSLITYLTHRMLKDKVIGKGIIEPISTREISRVLQEASIRPHKSRYWLNAKADERIADICSTYQSAVNKSDKLVTNYYEMT